MCPFLRDLRTDSWWIYVKQRKLVLFPLVLIIILGFTITATAYYFDFQYFETDRMVYEIGESISMVASLVADFSVEGYCFVSFAIVTEQGPAYADEFFIPPSPNVRLINSSYTIHPSATSPGENGITAYALFNVELYDSIIQGASDNIEITIHRGHLTLYPQSPLIVESGTNTTLIVKVASVHNSDIFYSNENLNINISNTESGIISNENITTDSDGNCEINWISSMESPGIYDVNITGFGNEDFLGFTETLQVSVTPAPTDLTVVSAPDSVHCQSPEGAYSDYADIIVKHENIDHQGIDDSTVYWNTSFDGGTFVSIGNGEYSVSILFDVLPGFYSINIDAINPIYQNATKSIMVEVVSNSLSFTLIENPQSVVHGDNISIEFSVDEQFNWNEEIPLELLDDANEIYQVITIYPGTITSLTISAWQNISVGLHNLTIQVINDRYNFLSIPEFQIIIIGELVVDITVEAAYYAENLLLNVSAMDYNENNFKILNISMYDNINSSLVIINQQINTINLVSFKLPLWINPGNHEFRFDIVVPYYTTEAVIKNVTVLMRTNITIIIGAINYSDSPTLTNNTEFSISLHQVFPLVLSFDRRQFCLQESLHNHL